MARQIPSERKEKYAFSCPQFNPRPLATHTLVSQKMSQLRQKM
jgi:hypothetical protein